MFRCKRLLMAFAVALAAPAAHAALTGSFAAGTLRIVSDADDDVRIDCAVDTAARVHVNLGTAADVPSPLCSEVVRIEIVGGPGDNETVLDGVLPTLFILLQTTDQRGGGGNDILDGSFAADTMAGDTGFDQMNGDVGADVHQWTLGDGNDIFLGGDGDDRTEITGGNGADRFRLRALADGVAIDVGVPVAETPVVFDTERVEVRGGDGVDRVETLALAGVTQAHDGGDPTVFPGDELFVAGAIGDLSVSPIVLPGGDPINHVNFEFIAPPPAQAVQKAAPLLQIDADATGSITAGDTLQYRVTATNTGSTDLHAVSVSDTRLTPSSTTCATLAPGADCVLTGTYVVTAQDAQAGQVVNTGTVASTEIPGPTPSNTVVTPVTLAPAPVFTVTKSAAVLTVDANSNGAVNLGDTLSYSIVLRNTGGVALTNVEVRDALLAPALRQCATVNPGAECVLTGTHVVSAAESAAGRVVNTASATSAQRPAPTPSNTVETAVAGSGGVGVPGATLVAVPVGTAAALLLLALGLLVGGARRLDGDRGGA